MKERRASPVEPVKGPPAMDPDRQQALATRASLLERLKDLEDQVSWQEFYTTYRKLMFSFALRHDLTPTEAEEVVQETVITVARNLPNFQYDPRRCSFKTWLFNLTLWRVRDQIRKRHPQETSIDRQPRDTDPTAAIERIPAAEGEQVSALWDEEWQQDLLARAMERLKARVDEKHYQIFDLYAIQAWPAREVARSFGVSAARVHLIKHRLSRLLAAELRQLQQE